MNISKRTVAKIGLAVSSFVIVLSSFSVLYSTRPAVGGAGSDEELFLINVLIFIFGSLAMGLAVILFRFSKKYKIMWIPTIIWAFMLLGFVLLNQPQCPSNFNDPSIDTSRCITGVNIGLGLYGLFIVFPYSIFMVLAWAIVFVKNTWKNIKTSNKN